MGKSVYEIVTEQILDKLEKGTIPWHKPWKTSGLSIKSWKNGREYRGINVFLLATSGKSGPWLTIKMINEAGGRIKKGEKSQLVIFWKTGTYTKENDDGEKESKKSFMLRYYRVWSLEQTTVPESAHPKWLREAKESTIEMEPIDACEFIVDNYKEKPPIEHGGDRAYYSPIQDEIRMPEGDVFDSGEEYYSTLFHELIHSTGHSSRINRFENEKKLNPFGSEDYSKEELIAEMGASFLRAHASIESDKVQNNSAAYIASWLKNLKDNPKMVVCAASAAQSACDWVLGKRYKEEENEN